MPEAIPLMPPPDPGWEWAVEEVNVGGSVWHAVVQQRLPEPPGWLERMESEGDWGHLVFALAALAAAARKIWSAWKGKA